MSLVIVSTKHNVTFSRHLRWPRKWDPSFHYDYTWQPAPQKPSNSRLCLRLFYWTFCLVMRLLFGAIVGILVMAVVAICLSICVFSCRPNAWGLALWRGCQRAAMASAIADLPPTSQRLPTIHHPLGHPSCRAELSFRPVCGRRFLATFSACAGRAVFELPPAVD